jgi:hypothetical protein
MRFVIIILALLSTFAPVDAANKSVLLYSRYFNAAGENRYLPEGNFKEILTIARKDFGVIVDSEPLTAAKLRRVAVVLIANPSDKAVSNNPAPPHIGKKEAEVLTAFVKRGGGVIVMGNQENHNLETGELNEWIRTFGYEFKDSYTDAKQLVIPKEVPEIGGLRWAYYTGNLLVPTDPKTKAAISVENDLNQKPVKGTRDQKGTLLAGVQFGKGRVVLVTDSGWLTTTALNGEGIGEVAIKEHDNAEIFRRLVKWAASGH